MRASHSHMNRIVPGNGVAVGQNSPSSRRQTSTVSPVWNKMWRAPWLTVTGPSPEHIFSTSLQGGTGNYKEKDFAPSVLSTASRRSARR